MMVSLMHTCGGISTTKRSVLSMSRGCNIWARSSGLGGIGRWSIVGVATSAGLGAQARKPLVHSSHDERLRFRLATRRADRLGRSLQHVSPPP